MKKFFLLILVLLVIVSGCKKSENLEENTPIDKNYNEINKPVLEKVDIVDLNSNSRPFAVVINNSLVAVKAQTGLQEAIVVYEFPVEGGLSRLMAIYKDASDLTIGTLRSARHNFIDYALEWDAVFVTYGWSHYAEKDMKKNIIDYINGVVNSTPFWRDNPLNLASEHTAYTSISKVSSFAENRGFKNKTDKGLVFSYDIGNVDLKDKAGVITANHIKLPYGGTKTEYEYDENLGLYKRFVNEKENNDYYFNTQYTAKNIIVQKINTKMASDNYYWDLETVGSGEGYFITNGYATPIKWEKTARDHKTKYTYLNGEEINLSDGNTFVQLQSTKQELTIE